MSRRTNCARSSLWAINSFNFLILIKMCICNSLCGLYKPNWCETIQEAMWTNLYSECLSQWVLLPDYFNIAPNWVTFIQEGKREIEDCVYNPICNWTNMSLKLPVCICPTLRVGALKCVVLLNTLNPDYEWLFHELFYQNILTLHQIRGLFPTSSNLWNWIIWLKDHIFVNFEMGYFGL